MNKINLIALPFAGGNRYCYRRLEQLLPTFIKLVALEYPGRGTRIREGLLTDIDLIVEDLYNQLRQLPNEKYAIYGHSMGGLLACLLTRRTIRGGLSAPVHLIITGTTGPSARSEDRKRHLLGKKEFLQEIRHMQGSPDEVLADEDVLEYFEPILRADFQASETYVHSKSDPLDLPFTIITGTEEDMTPQDVHAWQKESSLKVDFRRLPGKHFFIFDWPEKVAEIIARKLALHI
jgi:surfactin synthase thioesterase subunit